MLKQILVCVDGSERSIEAARVAAKLATTHHACLTLLHVCPLPALTQPFPGAPSFLSVMLALPPLEHYVEAMHGAVAERTLPAVQQANIDCKFLKENGNPVEVICHLADTVPFDLIVMGKRGLCEGTPAHPGSVSYGVVQSTHCPVLLVK